jgi:hypothetical protein
MDAIAPESEDGQKAPPGVMQQVRDKRNGNHCGLMSVVCKYSFACIPLDCYILYTPAGGRHYGIHAAVYAIPVKLDVHEHWRCVMRAFRVSNDE